MNGSDGSGAGVSPLVGGGTTLTGRGGSWGLWLQVPWVTELVSWPACADDDSEKHLGFISDLEADNDDFYIVGNIFDWMGDGK